MQKQMTQEQMLQMQQAQQRELIEGLKTSSQIKCQCGSMIFTQKMIFRKISSLVSPSGKAEEIPIGIHVCSECGSVKDDPILSVFNDDTRELLVNNGKAAE